MVTPSRQYWSPDSFAPSLLHGRNNVHAGGFQPLDVDGEAVAALGRVGAQTLEPLAGGRLAGAHALLDLALGRARRSASWLGATSCRPYSCSISRISRSWRW